jgi:hypothetical protein
LWWIVRAPSGIDYAMSPSDPSHPAKTVSQTAGAARVVWAPIRRVLTVFADAMRFLRRRFAGDGVADQPSELSGKQAFPERVRLPRTAYEIARVAGSRGLAIPDLCMPGVFDNLALLDTHARTLLDGPPEGDR